MFGQKVLVKNSIVCSRIAVEDLVDNFYHIFERLCECVLFRVAWTIRWPIQKDR